jgi:hypothetical protein
MKLNKTMILCGAALVGSMFATDAMAKEKHEANHEGMEFRFFLNEPILDGHSKTEFSGEHSDEANKALKEAKQDGMRRNKSILGGISGTIAIGYRFNKLFGLYYDQTIGSHLWLKVTDEDQQDAIRKSNENEGSYYYGATGFMGASYVTGRLFIALAHDVELGFDLGLGMMYDKGGDKDPGMLFKVENYPKDWKDYPSSPCFAFKVGLSFSYYISKYVGVGINFDYALGIHGYEYKVQDGTSLTQETTVLLHYMTPGIHAIAQF